MKAILDLRSGQWTFSHDTDEIRIGFTDGNKSVKFDGLSWGWSIGDSEKSYIDTGIIQSDQPYLSSDSINEEGEITLSVWAENAGQRYEDEIAYTYKSKQEFTLDRWRERSSLTRRKFMLGIKFYPHGEGTLESAINALRDSLEEPTKTVIGISLDESTHFDRNDPDLINMANEIGMTAEQVDDFYKFAENEQWRNG